MPTLTSFDEIKINVFFNEHLPPHIYVEYNESEVLLVIQTGEVYAGQIPSKQLKAAIERLAFNKTDVLGAFYELNPDLTYEKRTKKYS